MYKTPKQNRTQISVNNTTEGESIEHKFQRILNNKEPIKDGAPLIYTERSEGVKAGYNIRTDRFDVALDAMTVVHRAKTAQRDEKPKSKENDGEAETIHANDKE